MISTLFPTTCIDSGCFYYARSCSEVAQVEIRLLSGFGYREAKQVEHGGQTTRHFGLAGHVKSIYKLWREIALSSTSRLSYAIVMLASEY